MPVSPYDPEVAAPAAEGTAARRADANVRPEMRASPQRDEDDQRHDESIDEPGYGHGV